MNIVTATAGGNDGVRAGNLDGEARDAKKSVLLRARLFVFSALYAICKDVEPSWAIVLASKVVEFLQLVSFPMDEASAYPWNAGTTSWLSSISLAFRLYPVWTTSTSAAMAIWLIFVGILVLYLAVGVWVGLELAALNGKPFKYPTVLRFLRFVGDRAMGSWFIPIVGTHFAQLKCSQAAGNAFVQCGSGAHIIASVFAMVLLLCFVLVTVTLSSTFYARLPIAAAILSRPDARGHTLTLLFKLILVGIYSFLSSASYQWVTIVITLILMLLLSTYHAHTLPYYRHSWNTLHCCFLYGVLWCCFSVVLIQLVDSPLQTGVSLMFLLAFPVALLAGSLNVRMRRASIENSPMALLQSATEIELKARYVMEKVTDELRAAVVSNVELTMDDAKLAEHATALAEAMRILAYGTKRFPTAAMFLMQAQYVFSFAKNKAQGLIYLARAEQRSPALDETFTCYFHRKQNEEQFSAGETNADVIQYLAFQAQITEARRFDEIATRHQAEFWEELLKQTTETTKMNEIAIALNGAMSLAQDAFKKLMRMNPNSTQVLRMYASYLCDISNEPIAGNRLISRADELEDQRAKSHERGDVNNNLFDDGNALITISGELATMGEILDVNLNSIRMFGFSRVDMMGKNISMIMPAPFATHHQALLIKYGETGKSNILNRSRIVFGIHKSGWLVPLDLFVREVATADGMTFLGVLRAPAASQLGAAVALQQIATAAVPIGDAQTTQLLAQSQGANQSVHFAFVETGSGKIAACTTGCATQFGVTVDEVRARAVDAARWVPDLGDATALKEVRSPTGRLTFVTLPGGRQVYMHVMQSLVRVASDEFYLTHFCERQPPSGSHLAAGAVGDEDDDEEEEEDDGLDVSDDEEDEEESEQEDKSAESEESDSDEGSDEDSDDDVAPAEPAGPVVVGLSLENLQAHNSTFGNKEVPLFDKGNFRKQKGKGKKGGKSAPLPAVAAVAAKPAAATKSKPKARGASFAATVQVVGGETALPQTVAVGGASVTLSLSNNPLFAAPQGSMQLGPEEPAQSAPRAPAAVKSTLRAIASGMGGKASSQSSKSSGSSRSSASVLHSKLTAFARSREGADLGEGIRNLRAMLVLALVFASAIAIISEIVQTYLTADFVTRLDSQFQAGERRYLNIRLAMSAHMLVQMATPTFVNIWTPSAVLEPLRARILRDCAALTWINNLLYVQRRTQLSEAHLAMYQDQATVVTYNVHSTSSFYELPASLWDSQQAILAQARTLVDMVAERAATGAQIYDTEAPIYYLMRNALANGGVRDFFHVVNQTCFLYQADASSRSTLMQAWAFVFLFAGIMMVVIVSFVVVRPRVLDVEKNKDDVLLLFGDIPYNLLLAFHQKVSRRLAALRAALSGEDAEEKLASDKTLGDDADVDPVAAAAAALGATTVGGATRAELQAEDAQGGQDGRDGRGEHDGAASAGQVKVSVEDADEDGDDEGADDGETQLLTASDRALKRAQKNKQRIQQNASFFERNLTMLKVSFIVVVTIIYFAVSFMVQYGWVQQKFNSAAAQVNYASHRRASVLLIVHDLRRLLTQNFWKTYEAGSTGYPTITEQQFFADFNFLEDVNVGLVAGSTRFGVDAPLAFETEQIEITQRNACAIPAMAGAGVGTCADFYGDFGTAGIKGAVLSFLQASRAAYALVNGTLNNIPSALASNTSVAMANHIATAYLQPAVFDGANKDKGMAYVYNSSDTFLDVAFNRSALLYRDSVAQLVASYQVANIAILVAFVLICLFMFVFFYNPMCWTLDAEQKRTSAMLLMIPGDVMERLPTIRDFVQKLGSRSEGQ